MALPDLVTLFCELAAIPSPPGEERAVADRVAEYVRELGLEVDEDGTGPEVGSTIGNLLVRAAPSDGGTSIFLCAHLDTVPPTDTIEPMVEDGVVRNARPTILGADNKAAVAVMLESVRRAVEERRPHGGIELVFTPEGRGRARRRQGVRRRPSRSADRLRVRPRRPDRPDRPPGAVVHRDRRRLHGPSRARGHGARGRPLGDLRGRARRSRICVLVGLDEDTTANIGEIHGGTARNIVPDRCVVVAEARSQDERKLAELVQEMLDSFAFAASVAECEVETALEEKYRGYRLSPDEPAVRLADEALRRAGFEPELVVGGGGADANVFNLRGRPCVNLANGMARIHSSDEHIAVEDLERMVDVTLALVDAARAA